MHFPVVTGSNLLRQELTLPRDLGGELNIVLIAFQRWQQAEVDTWLPWAEQLERTHAGVRAYELPTIQRLNRLVQAFIDGGMRAGIPDPVARERTITLYVDKGAFRRALDLPNEDAIYVLLLDRAGQVLGRAAGVYTPEKGEALARAIAGPVEP